MLSARLPRYAFQITLPSLSPSLHSTIFLSNNFMPTRKHDPAAAQDHYAVLSLPTTPPPSEQTIRHAYRRALLLHHPDKSKSFSNLLTPSIDHITTAYKTLVDPLRREEYDRRITLRTSARPTASALEQYPGLETVDLEEMNFVAGNRDGDGVYWRGCRCGNATAYEVPERELEAYVEEGEIVTGCQGCSLWLRVLFASAAEEDAQEDDAVAGKEG